MVEIQRELYVFFCAVWTGAVIVGVYRLLCAGRYIKQHTTVWINIEDFIFWVWSCVYLFWRMFQLSNGEIRWYFLLGVVFGGIGVYLVSKKVINLILILKKYLKKRKK